MAAMKLQHGLGLKRTMVVYRSHVSLKEPEPCIRRLLSGASFNKTAQHVGAV